MSPPSVTSPGERRDYIVELRRQGLIFREIGDRLGISAPRARELYLHAELIQVRAPLLRIEEVTGQSPVALLPLSARTRHVLEFAGIRTFD